MKQIVNLSFEDDGVSVTYIEFDGRDTDIQLLHTIRIPGSRAWVGRLVTMHGEILSVVEDALEEYDEAPVEDDDAESGEQ